MSVPSVERRVCGLRTLLSASLALFALVTCAADPAGRTLHTLAFRNATVYDGSGKPPLRSDELSFRLCGESSTIGLRRLARIDKGQYRGERRQ